jgi:SagB-type dehydrogenase family enzyme
VETATQALHRLTSYEPGRDWDEPVDDPRVLQDLVTNEIERLPWFFKRYPETLPRVELPRELPATTAPAVAVLAGTAQVEPGELDLPQLSRLLHLAAGVVRTTERPYGTWLFRAAGSAGSRSPFEVYVAVPEGGALPAGVHWYHPQAHALVQIGTPPVAGLPAVVVTGVPWRTGWRYRERGYRHTYWDIGTMLAQLLAAADSAGLEPTLYTRFPDRAVGALVGSDGVHEWPVAVVGLGGDPALGATGEASTGEVDAAPVELPLATAAQRAGDSDELGEPWQQGAPVDVPEQGTEPLENVVLARSSQRRMDPAGSLSESVTRSALAVSLRGIDLPHFVAVNAVDGLEPGVYRWPDLATPLRTGEQRRELHRICLDQGLPRDAAFVVIGAADVSALDDREYREAQLAAGLVEGRLHLAAYALGASASGMTFLDSEIAGFVGEPLDGLLFTCVGVPEYRPRPGGLPGAPSEIRPVTPRLDDE